MPADDRVVSNADSGPSYEDTWRPVSNDDAAVILVRQAGLDTHVRRQLDDPSLVTAGDVTHRRQHALLALEDECARTP